jgi:hypothetical protein
MIQILESKNMTPEQFTYWLQGFTEISQQAPTEQQWKVIKDHLQLVFKKETPNYTIATGTIYESLTQRPQAYDNQIIC